MKIPSILIEFEPDIKHYLDGAHNGRTLNALSHSQASKESKIMVYNTHFEVL